jgi:sulfide dehydrogenase [flavocytochrome c] flavoprotein subunit
MTRSPQSIRSKRPWPPPKAAREFGYDFLVLSPGVDFNYGAIQGYRKELAETKMPHAWKAGPRP